ncbi:MAG: twin-arginine translocase TatA/TatE family subunit [Candidatus Marinimicrobia bacterium]|jgi:sec-independent protein translocase protein TatA|nr:twin-arginine translocase TatA/TatE family subunit [Candidatus Neomarinimicrobiota bacterium]MAR29944.1 twin-arginine translocase TatA/TatE family subunit [Candidatus Neomarinimicrobiota bacterium]|tara:strand:- start:303 stop:470 length:168 start_codon:yes stop_codon:yes gene_type:complete
MRFPGTFEIILIILAIILLFGAKKIPEIARGLGKGLKEFKKAKDEVSESLNSDKE